MPRLDQDSQNRNSSAITFPQAAKENPIEYAKNLGAPEHQLAFAQELAIRGFAQKARRAALCCLLGRMVTCAGVSSHSFYLRFGCGLRGCQRCSRIASKWTCPHF